MAPTLRTLGGVGLVLFVLGCGDGGDDDPAAPELPAPTSTAPAATGSDAPVDVEPSAALSESQEAVYEVSWEELVGAPYYAYDDVRDPDDPFWHVHTNPEADGFFLSLEMFTTGYGSGWEGETGTHAVDCSEAGTGICLHFNPDGPLQDGDLGGDFAVTGNIRIDQLDDRGYALVLTDIAFSDGSTIPGPVILSG